MVHIYRMLKSISATVVRGTPYQVLYVVLGVVHMFHRFPTVSSSLDPMVRVQGTYNIQVPAASEVCVMSSRTGQVLLIM